MAYEPSFRRPNITDPVLARALQQIEDEFRKLGVALGSAGGGAVAKLDDIGDVDAPAPNANDIIVFNAGDGKWANAPYPAAGAGDMEKATYDTDEDGVVEEADHALEADEADTVDGQHASAFAEAGHDHDADYAPIAKGVTNGDSHDHNGGDGAAVPEAGLSLADNTTGDVSKDRHGFAPKAPDDTAKFLRGDGAWAEPSIPDLGFFRINLSGDYIGPSKPGAIFGNSQAGAFTLDYLFAFPLLITKPTDVDSLNIVVTSGNAVGRSACIGLATDDGAGYPDALLEEGEISCATTGLKTVTFAGTRTLNPGLYWLLLTTNNSTPAFKGFAYDQAYGLWGFTDITASTRNPIWWVVARTYDSALPGTFPGGAARGGTTATVIPMIGLKIH